MTKEAFLIQQAIISEELHYLMKRQDKKRDELDQLRDDYCHQLCEENQKYKDKMIKVVFERTDPNIRVRPHTEHKECIGFLTGFSFKCRCEAGIYPTIAKVKKDGTPSKVEFSTWEMLPWNDVKTIEVIQ